MSPKALLCCLPAVLMTSLSLRAVAAPDAGSLLQQIESQAVPAQSTPTLKKPTRPTPAASNEAGAVVQVTEFRLEGHQLLSTETLQRALAGFTGRALTLTQLQEAAWVVIQTYREAGWLANALVPPQEIDQGIVKLNVLEAKLGQVRIDVPQDAQVPRAHIQAMVDAQLLPGQPVNLHQVDRLVLLIDDLPGILAKASFAEGTQPGSTDVLVRLGLGNKTETHLMLDNFGAVSTGTHRLSVNAAVNNVLGLGDVLAIQAVASEGSTYVRLAYTLPVGLQGLLAGVHASGLGYKLGRSFADQQSSGTAQTWGFDLTAPLLRSPARNLSWQFNTDHKKFDNQTLAGTVSLSNYQIDVLRAGFNAKWRDQAITPSQNAAGLQLTLGSVHLNNSPNAAKDKEGERTEGPFKKLSLSYNREQSLTGQLTGYLQAGAQFASRNLDSSEKLYLGGASGVRAYPSNEAGGSSGYTLTVGLKQRIDQAWTLNGFTDWGRIQEYKNNMDAAGIEPLSGTNTQALQGLGLTLSWRDTEGRELAATWSRRQGNNPALRNGTDSDGTHTINRLWLSAALNF
jgi:hemolysin activation/secretion protein